jgi:hypothetical protein
MLLIRVWISAAVPNSFHKLKRVGDANAVFAVSICKKLGSLCEEFEAAVLL